MPHDYKAIVRRYVDEIYNHGHVAVAGELVTDDYVNHLGFEAVEGVEGVRQFVAMLRAAFPDAHETIEVQLVEGNKEVHRWILRGTHRAEYMGIPATGKQVEVQGITIARFKDDKVAEEWTRADMLGLLQQLGAIPA